MDAWPFIILLILGIPIALGVWLILRAVKARKGIEELKRRVGDLELELVTLKTKAGSTLAREDVREQTHKAATIQIPSEPSMPVAPIAAAEAGVPIPPKLSLPPPTDRPFVAPSMVAAAGPKSPPVLPRIQKPSINWEQFMGVKGFAWLGGFALFLGVVFFVKYSFEHNLVPPELRVALGFLTGLLLLAGGVGLHRRQQYVIGAQALCATGVVILYAVTFACRSIYHFEFFTPIIAFLLMALVTGAAFLIAVRLNALIVAILGMVGGFLTPFLLSTGVDNPIGLFGYIAILDVGLLLVALNCRWHFLSALGALGTAIMQIGWADEFFVSGKYFEGNKILSALSVLIGFNLLFLAGSGWAKRNGRQNGWLTGANLGLAAVAFAFVAFFFTFQPLAARPGLLFGFMFVIDLVVATLAWLNKDVKLAQPIAGLAVFGLLAIWTAQRLTNDLLNTALVFYFVFAFFHSVLPTLLQRMRGEAGAPVAGSHLFPPLALLLVLLPIFNLTELSFAVWPFVLLVDVLAIALAVLSMALIPVLVVLVITLAATAELIFKIPSDLTGLPTAFFLIGAFAVFFVVATVWLARKLKPEALKCGLKLTGDAASPETLAALLPACSAVLPFLLLVMATLRLPLANPSPVFGLALLLVVLLLGLTVLFRMDWMPVVGLAGVVALECAWHFNRLDIANAAVPPTLPLIWYLVFFAVFAVYPFVFLRKFADKLAPWIAAALAGPAQFVLVYRLVRLAWPGDFMGLLPAAFAVPALLSLVLVLKRIPAESKARMTQLALFGGVGLFFITLILPIQFDRQWITIGWALEGAALLWLFHRVPHPGLRLVGVGLLIAAFVRLAFNPAVLAYHPRSNTPIVNWYLYTYGIATVALFAGARLLASPRQRVLGSNAQAVLATLGTVLAFLLLNIEIADYFSVPGSTLTFQFRGSLERDMTYSIAWGLFALVLLFWGILKKIPGARYSAMGLLCVTLVKLFFHDLAHLSQLYRIGAFVGVAVIAILASFAYQKFYATIAKGTEAKEASAKSA